MMYRALPSFIFASLLTIASSYSAELKNENLLQNVPNGYKIDYQNKEQNVITMEMVPEQQSVNNADEMVTTQIMLGLKNITPQKFQATMQKMWSEACQGSQFVTIKEGKENGYPFSFWLQGCPNNPETGKPEYTYFKAIQGNDSFYVVQKAFRFNPTKEQIVQWSQYLHSVEVCDSRLPKSKCPKIK